MFYAITLSTKYHKAVGNDLDWKNFATFLLPVRKNTGFSDPEKKWEKYSSAMQSAANSLQFVDFFKFFFEIYNCYPDDTAGYDYFFFGAFLLGFFQSIRKNPQL